MEAVNAHQDISSRSLRLQDAAQVARDSHNPDAREETAALQRALFAMWTSDETSDRDRERCHTLLWASLDRLVHGILSRRDVTRQEGLAELALAGMELRFNRYLERWTPEKCGSLTTYMNRHFQGALLDARRAAAATREAPTRSGDLVSHGNVRSITAHSGEDVAAGRLSPIERLDVVLREAACESGLTEQEIAASPVAHFLLAGLLHGTGDTESDTAPAGLPQLVAA